MHTVRKAEDFAFFGGTATAAAPARQRVRTREEILAEIPELASGPGWRFALLRTIEILVGLATLGLTLPVMAILAAVVRLDSKGPALFRQPRLTKGGKIFYFYKFRTLYVDARQRFPELYAYRYNDDEIDNLTFKITDDPRVTRVGRWLRKSTLDELPNFINLLTGEVALVGPRPEIPEMLRYYVGEDLLKFAVRPGITGLSQTSGRANLTFRETARLDREYVKTRSWHEDLRIVLRTIKLVVKRDGAF